MINMRTISKPYETPSILDSTYKSLITTSTTYANDWGTKTPVE